MAEQRTVYDSTGDKPTNWQEFENDDTSVDDSKDSDSSSVNEDLLEESFLSIASNASIITSLCSTVGAVLYESWKNRGSASAETNMFAALADIIDELKTTNDDSTASITDTLSNVETYVSVIAEHVEASKAEDAQRFEDLTTYLDLIVENLQDTVTKQQSIAKGDVDMYIELIAEYSESINTLLTDKLDAIATYLELQTEYAEQNSIANNKANAGNAPNISEKHTALAQVFATVIDALSNMTPVKRAQLEMGLETVDLIADRFEKAAPKFETGINKFVDAYIAAAQRLKDNKEVIAEMKDFVQQIEGIVAALDRTTESIMKGAAAIALMGLAIWSFGELVTVQAIGMLALGTAAFIATYWAITQITNEDASKGATNVMMIAGALGMVALSMMLFSNVSIAGILAGAAGILAIAGAIWILGKALSGQSLLIGRSSGSNKSNSIGTEMLMLSGSIALFVLAVVAAGEVLATSWESVALIFAVIVGLGIAVGFANGLTSIGQGVGMKISGDSKAFGALQQNGSVKGGLGTQMLMISGAIAILALSIWAWHELIPSWDYAMAPALTVVGLALAIATANRIAGKDGDMQKIGTGILAMSAAIGVLALSIFAWRIVEPDDAIKALIGIAVLSGIMIALSKFTKDNTQLTSMAVSMLAMSASIAVLGLAMLPWKLVDWDDMAKAGAAVTVLVGALWGITAIGSKEALLASAALVVSSVAIGLLAGSLLIANSIDGSTAITLGLFLAAEVGAIAILGNLGAASLLGAAALVLSATATLMIATALEKVQPVDGTTMLSFGAFIAAVSLAATGLGFVGPLALLGAAAMAATGAATLVFAAALEKVSSIGSYNSDALVTTMTSLVAVATATGNPFTVVFTLAGAAALTTVGAAALLFAKTIKEISEVNLTEDELNAVGSNLASFIVTIVTAISDNEDKMKSAKKGINAISGLGNLVYSLAEGLKGMASLVFPKYEARNGELVITGTIDLNEALPKVGQGLGTVINSLADALIAVGEEPNVKGKMRKAKKSFEGIGEVISPLVNIITSFAQNKIDVAYIEQTFAPTSKAAMVAIRNMFDEVSGLDTDHIEDVGDSLDSFFKVIDVSDLKKKNSALQSTATNIENIQKAIDSLNFEKLTKLNMQYSILQSNEMIEGLRKVAATIDGPLVTALKKLFTTLEEFINNKNEQSTLGSMNVLPAQSSTTIQPLIKLGTFANPVEGADKYAEFADDSSNPIMSILVDLYELLDSQGIRVHQ